MRNRTARRRGRAETTGRSRAICVYRSNRGLRVPLTQRAITPPRFSLLLFPPPSLSLARFLRRKSTRRRRKSTSLSSAAVNGDTKSGCSLLHSHLVPPEKVGEIYHRVFHPPSLSSIDDSKRVEEPRAILLPVKVYFSYFTLARFVRDESRARMRNCVVGNYRTRARVLIICPVQS